MGRGFPGQATPTGGRVISRDSSFFRIVWARLSRQSSQEGNSKYAPLFNRSVEKGIIETIVLFSQRVAFSPAFIHQRMHAI